MTDKRRFSRDHDTRREPIHTPGGMAEPPAGESGDGADLASTDMSAEPGSRDDGTQAGLQPGRERPGRARGGGDSAAGVPAGGGPGPATAARGRVRQLPQAGVARAGGAERPGPGVAGHPPARRPGRHGPSERRGQRRLGRVAAASGRPWWTGSCGRSWRPRASSASTRSGSRSIPAFTRPSPLFPPPKPELDHTVSATFQPGYRFKGNLVRPAQGAGVLRAGPGLTCGIEGLLSGPRRPRVGRSGRYQEGVPAPRQAVPP